ncbi:Transcription initiation factor TFIID, subunit TAF12 (also component of histone acetyltransferase SAGA) [Buttiauxella agrestis]|uniref:Transcription initiation factor TFIID, subunit TAF12 (Also component of histone acetyltransferase SAGA) n=1 Tax=Buttiauxella agrestis TaxID=82977 RepID=A0A381KN40_9ENTR|nr:hypothetical protein [Buttiauxella agrestis]SUY92780.1 Transcription initiation factor TFIID, subunit TAF12 (also component of histone acetyltransferase SAGA) [Buttiauxella agrestis]
MTNKLSKSPRQIERLRNIANVISGIPGVEVIISSAVSVPCFNIIDSRVSLPDGDYSDPEFVALCEGYICHEAGHGRYTSKDVWFNSQDAVYESSPGFKGWEKKVPVFDNRADKMKALAKVRRIAGLMNLFDDVQMEKRTGLAYEQAKHRLAVMYAILCQKGFYTTDTTKLDANPVDIIEWYILSKLRTDVLGQEGDKAILDDFFAYSEKLFGPLRTEIDLLLKKAHGVNSTEDASKLAIELFELLNRLKEEANKQKEQQDSQQQDGQQQDGQQQDSQQQDGQQQDGQQQDSQQQDGQQQDGQQQDSQQQDSQQQDGQQQDGQQQDGQQQDSQQQDSQQQDDQQQDGQQQNSQSSNNDNGDSSEKSNFSKSDWVRIADMLEAFVNSDDESKDYHDIVSNMIEQITGLVPSEIKKEFGGDDSNVPDLVIDLPVYNEALRLSHALSGSLSVLQQAEVRVKNKTRDRGVSFDNRRLIQAPMGVRDIFKAQGLSKQRGQIGVVILRDNSASMVYDSRYEHAIKADLALTLALESLSKVHVSNMIFPGHESFYEVIKPFNMTVEETLPAFEYSKKGRWTPTGYALKAAIQILQECQFDRKIILILTDGQPSKDDLYIPSLMEMAAKSGVEVAGVGIKTKRLFGFESKQYVQVDDVKQLTRVVNDLVFNILIN